MHLIVGLGNPGTSYSETRHNVGFMVADELAQRYRLTFQKERMYRIARKSGGKFSFIVIKPETYMNNSGRAFLDVSRRYKIPISCSLTICDDLNLPFGTIRMRPAGSDGGQKGLRSIAEHLNSDAYPRLRIGIGTSDKNATDYVLSPFSDDERQKLAEIISYAVDAVESFIRNGIDVTMNRYNRSIFTN